MKKIDVMFTRTNDGDYIADFDCAPSELPESNVFFFQAISAVDLVRAEAAEARAEQLAAQLATANTLAHTRLQKIEYLEIALEACREMQHNAESRVNELQEWYNESVRRNESSAIGAQILENERNDARAQLATAQIPCKTCGGSGFSKPGSGYDAVCDHCTGGYVGYATGEMVNKMQTRINELTAERDAIRKAMNDYMNDVFAHTAPPTDWDQETPFGQMIDGIGDEVEP